MGKLKELFLQAVKFGLVGVLNTLVDMGVFWLLTRLPFFAAYYGLSHTISFACGMLNSFIWNRRWTFQDKRRMTGGRALRFVLVNAASYGASLLVLTLLVRAGYPEMSAKVIATPCALAVNFLGNKLFVFKDA